ncbi:hypothetical protein BDR07DRAFT_4372 [Suillus spraguei]|nr:hypothetical protein BDR07DRAFT_4372 [Suillus spraguei]
MTSHYNQSITLQETLTLPCLSRQLNGQSRLCCRTNRQGCQGGCLRESEFFIEIVVTIFTQSSVNQINFYDMIEAFCQGSLPDNHQIDETLQYLLRPLSSAVSRVTKLEHVHNSVGTLL